MQAFKIAMIGFTAVQASSQVENNLRSLTSIDDSSSELNLNENGDSDALYSNYETSMETDEIHPYIIKLW